MYETKSKLKYCKDIIEEFNKKSNKWKAKISSVWTQNISLHCVTIKIKENRFFGESFLVDYWDNGVFDIKVLEDFDLKPFIEPIKLFEKISSKEIEVIRLVRM